MRLRPRIALVCCVAALVSVGVTGALLIRESRVFAQEQLSQRQELFVRNRALAISASLAVAMGEMLRLSHMAEVDLSDNDLRPEAALLAHAHRNSTLFNIGLEIEDGRGRCLWSEPANDGCPGHDYAREPWFVAGRLAKGPLVVAGQPASKPNEINVVVPIGGRLGAADGVLRGIIDLRSDRVVSPALTNELSAGTEVALVSQGGDVVFPAHLGRSAGWDKAVTRATTQAAGTLLQEEDGVPFLYAYAPVEGVGLGVVFRWRYASLDTGLARQLQLLLEILTLGGLLAIVLGFLSARFLVQPLEILAGAVRVLGLSRASEQPGGETDGVRQTALRRDELGELAQAFSELRQRLAAGDEQHREDLERIRELASSLDARVRARTAELEAAQGRLVAQERLAAMGRAAAVISHEMKNSLNALGLGVDFLALDAPEGSQIRKVDAQVRAEVNRLRSMTDGLLVFAKPPRLDAHPTDINELLRTTVRLCEEQALSAGVQVHLTLALDGLPLIVPCDAGRMQSVLVNLLQNAIEALALQKNPREVRITSQERGSRPGLVTIRFEDNGPGVSQEAREHLFEPFFTTKRNGTGLGLATSQRFVAAHGGSIELEDSALGGACLVVSFDHDDAVAEPGRRMNDTVLVIDDEKSFRVIAEEALKREGYLVRTAENGAVGAQMWRDEPADVVLLDRNLPDIDGVDLLATLVAEAQDCGVDTLFLITTAYADVENAVQALRRGAEDYLTKPLQLQDLLLKVSKALEARRLRNRVRALRRETRGGRRRPSSTPGAA